MDCVVYGAGGHGRVVHNILSEGGVYHPVAFLDSNPELAGTTLLGLPVGDDLRRPLRDGVRAAVVGVGGNTARPEIARRLVDAGYELINAIHPRAYLSSGIKHFGNGVVVCAGAQVCTGCTIGDSVILNTGCIVDHECTICSNVHICPGARLAGRVRIGKGAFIGLGTSVIQNVTVGEHAVVGAGAVVVRDVPPHTTVKGVPAR